MTLRVDVLLEGFLLVPEEYQASLLLASLRVPAVVGGGIGRSLQRFPKGGQANNHLQGRQGRPITDVLVIDFSVVG
jgi:hypothetical protein